MRKKDLKANHVCAVCGNKYYSCDYCSRIASWRRLCDTIECYQVLMASQLPAKEIRLDKTDKELEDIMKKPVEEVLNDTKEELSDYKDIIEKDGIGKAVEAVNNDIKNKSNKAKRKKKK